MWVKLAMIAGLIAVHIMLSRWRRAFAEDRNNHPAKLFRIVNEVPALLLVVIVVCVSSNHSDAKKCRSIACKHFVDFVSCSH
jgi:uncharacterized membrane protein